MDASLIDSRIYGHNWATPESQSMFSERSRLRRWLAVVTALAGAQADLGIIPASSAAAIAAIDAEQLDIDAIAAGTRQTSHSTLGLIHVLQDMLPAEAREHVYHGATVQDVSDTAMSLEVRELTTAVGRDLWAIEGALVDLAERHRTTPMLGRTHGQPGAPISFGYKVATWADEVGRSLERLRDGGRRWHVGQLAGAVGAMAFHGADGPALRERFCAELGLDAPLISWTTTRDRLAEFAATLAIAATTLQRIANEVYNLQRGEIGELAEATSPSTIGSITMPHKRNPENSEQIIVLGRIIRALAATVTDTMAGEHERDGATWKGEWLVVPQLGHHVLASLSLSAALVDGLIVNERRMRDNLDRYGFADSQELLRRLSTRLGKHRAQDELGRAYRTAAKTGAPIDELLAAIATEDELDGLSEPALGSAPTMVDEVVAAVRARRANEDPSWT
ncbi:MAG: lyase family protein [Acidimicrobiia bacterium]|nr:lyase family protein [Acidimicrobiia bacterium]